MRGCPSRDLLVPQGASVSQDPKGRPMLRPGVGPGNAGGVVRRLGWGDGRKPSFGALCVKRTERTAPQFELGVVVVRFVCATPKAPGPFDFYASPPLCWVLQP